MCACVCVAAAAAATVRIRVQKTCGWFLRADSLRRDNLIFSSIKCAAAHVFYSARALIYRMLELDGSAWFSKFLWFLEVTEFLRSPKDEVIDLEVRYKANEEPRASSV